MSIGYKNRHYPLFIVLAYLRMFFSIIIITFHALKHLTYMYYVCLYFMRNGTIKLGLKYALNQRAERKNKKKEVEAHKTQKKTLFFLSYNIFSFTLCCLLNLTASLHKFYIKNLFLYFTLVCYNTREQAAAKTELESM